MNQTLTPPSTENTFTIEKRVTVKTTENQRKVIAEKYLKGSASIEEWLQGVARNIATAELLYHPSSHLWGLYDGVRSRKVDTGTLASNASEDTPSQTTVRLLHADIHNATERNKNFSRFLSNCLNTIENHKDARKIVATWEDRFFDLLATWKFLPNSPTLMNANRELQQLSACYVIPIDDSLEGITHSLQAQALIHKSGGGTGFSFERIRPAGDPVKSTKGVASGAISFMKVFDKLTEVVKQGGNRRGANMAILPYWHPEIKEFIQIKNRPGQMENFNLSVAIDDRFIEAVQKDWSYQLLNPRTKESMGLANARELFDTIVENAWKTGDPGIIFIDRINQSASHPTPDLGAIEATNPCGEQPLLPNEPCNLGSINISKFIDEDQEPPQIDWEALRETIFLSVRFLDNVIDMNNYPLGEMENLAKSNRRIGLGLMGWAESLVKMKIPYDSERALQIAGEVMKFFNEKALKASEELAKSRGMFPNWKNSIYDPTSQNFRGSFRKPRHCARTTIAPTGTISLAAGLQGSGIEPFYGMAYTRLNAKAVESLKEGTEPVLADVYYEVNPLFKKVAQKNNYFGLTEKELWRKIERNNRSIRGLSEIPNAIQALFPAAHDVSPDFHIKMQAAFQEFTDNAVSKTVNLPYHASAQQVKNAYLLACQLNVKGVTVYRDGSKQQQVLNLLSSPKEAPRRHDFSRGVSSEYYEIKTGHGTLHVHIDYDENGPFRVFASLPPVGTELSALTSLLGVLLSKYLEEGGEPQRLLKHLQSIKGDRPVGLGPNKINSIPHAISVALRSHLKKHNGLLPERDEPQAGPSELELWKLAQANEACPNCVGENY